MASHDQAAEIIATLFLARDIAHRAHLAVDGPGSFARHDALGAFYEAVVGLADDLAETYQGRFDVLLDIPLLDAPPQSDIMAALASQREWLRKTRYEAIPKEETPLQNIVDEIEALYSRTHYKLKRLQ